MDYKNLYDALIKKAKINQNVREKQRKEKFCYFEKHHIIPKCLNGLDKNENMVLLTAREHFISHWLLVKIYPNETKLIYARWRMVHDKRNKYCKITSKKYELLREQYSLMMMGKMSGENNSFYGKKHSEETLRKCGQAFLGRKHSDSTLKKMSKSHKGFKHTKDSIERMSKSKLGYKCAESTKQKIRNSKLGVKNSKIQNKKISNAMKGRILTTEWKQKIKDNQPKLEPWEHSQVRNNSDRLKKWVKAHIIYDIWINLGVCKEVKLMKKCIEYGVFDKKESLGSMINWFIKNGNPTNNLKWSTFNAQ